jgi:sec-independent protein translocase protein TatC
MTDFRERRITPPSSQPATSSADELAAGNMPLLAHLLELRNRLLKSITFLFALFALFMTLCFSDAAPDFYRWVTQPITNALPHGSTILATGTFAPFLAPVKLSFFIALYLSIPFILHQLWGFISPGLYAKEKKFALPLLISSVLLFYCGMAFAYFLVFPVFFKVMASIHIPGVTYMPDITQSIDVMLGLFFSFGLAFEVPIATILLIWTGIVTPESLAVKRPYIIIGCFAVGAVLTPPDVLSQLMLSIPMWLLFEAGLLVGRVFYKRESDES